MTGQAKRSDNSASGSEGPRLEGRFGEAGRALGDAAHHVGAGIKKATNAFRGVTGREVAGFAERTVQSGVDLVKPLGDKAGQLLKEVRDDLASIKPSKSSVSQLNEHCQRHRTSRPSYQTTESAEGSFELLWTVSVVVKDRAHNTVSSKKCSAPILEVARNEAAQNLLEKLQKRT